VWERQNPARKGTEKDTSVLWTEKLPLNKQTASLPVKRKQKGIPKYMLQGFADMLARVEKKKRRSRKRNEKNMDHYCQCVHYDRYAGLRGSLFQH
jgi:hypothetical protein